ncbi:CPBP family intramembrane glutamic endopeptidase [Candidatus Neptunichlamydia sp. REUL1]|uniref:CPBP family intramembrane glutamic endopeptidase n=1 Tax=Candidatus Neptunichlamydia sp. REUL1 TaxID=3064277 RepID=UPI00292D4B74|nr:CPBP family intramembrane glutamic endopeptidase [Candidatus Neptunochlamydia sp. REUL1]
MEVNQNKLFPWANVDGLFYNTIVGGITGIGIYKIDEYYLKNMNSIPFFKDCEPQKTYQNILESKKNSSMLKFKVVCFHPILEEAVFRGLFRQKQIESNEKVENILSKINRYVLNSAVFGISHYDFHRSFRSNIKISPPIFLSGMVFNALMDTTECIAAPTAAHSVANLLSYKRTIA